LKFLEFGTVKMPAKPFLEPALIEKRQEALNKIAEVVRRAIESG
jgi:HK97 gp10 family phage protein